MKAGKKILMMTLKKIPAVNLIVTAHTGSGELCNKRKDVGRGGQGAGDLVQCRGKGHCQGENRDQEHAEVQAVK